MPEILKSRPLSLVAAGIFVNGFYDMIALFSSFLPNDNTVRPSYFYAMLSMIVGVLMLWAAVSLFMARPNAYKWTVVLYGCNLAFVGWGVFNSGLGAVGSAISFAISLTWAIVVFTVLYRNRDKFSQRV